MTIARAGLESSFLHNYMHININVSDICNFSCSYCINTSSKNKGKRSIPFNTLKNFIEDLPKSKSSYVFSIAGGEPLIYPHIFDMVNEITKIKCHDKTIWISTNGSLLPQKIAHLYNLCNDTKLKFTVSVHIEQIILRDFAQKIAKSGHADDIMCKILCPPGRKKEIFEIQSILEEFGLSVVFQPITYPKGKPFPYTDEEIDFLHQNKIAQKPEFFHEYVSEKAIREEFGRIKRTLHPEKLNYFGMFCTAGMTTLRLAPDGTCSRCFGFLRKGEKFDLNVLRLRDIPELTQPCICPVDFCTCLTFLQAAKWRKSEDAPAWLK